MKKLVIITLLVGLALTSSLCAKSMTGLTAKPSFSGPGLGFRQWVSPSWGWALQAQPSWAFDDIIASGRLMKTVKTTEKTRWFALIGGGYTAINDKNDGMEFSVSMPSFQAGIGFEKLFGFKKNKGWGLEFGYQYAQADYTIEYEYTDWYTGQTLEMTIEDTYTLPPIFIGASFAYYFGK